jgi:hypothetical protein
MTGSAKTGVDQESPPAGLMAISRNDASGKNVDQVGKGILERKLNDQLQSKLGKPCNGLPNLKADYFTQS